MSKTRPLIKFPNLSLPNVRKCRHHSSISQTKLEPSLAPLSLSVMAHISPSVDPIGSSLSMHPASKFFSTLLHSHLGPSNHHLSPGWEGQHPHWSPGFYPSGKSNKLPPSPVRLISTPSGSLAIPSYHGPCALTVFSAKKLSFQLSLWLISCPLQTFTQIPSSQKDKVLKMQIL